MEYILTNFSKLYALTHILLKDPELIKYDMFIVMLANNQNILII